jgi:hypothetical protein
MVQSTPVSGITAKNTLFFQRGSTATVSQCYTVQYSSYIFNAMHNLSYTVPVCVKSDIPTGNFSQL